MTRNVNFFVFSHGGSPNSKMKDKIRHLRRGDLSPRQAKTRQMKGENTPLINVSYLRLAGRKVTTRKPAKK